MGRFGAQRLRRLDVNGTITGWGGRRFDSTEGVTPLRWKFIGYFATRNERKTEKSHSRDDDDDAGRANDCRLMCEVFYLSNFSSSSPQSSSLIEGEEGRGPPNMAAR